jgi:hypothetical protein
MKMGGRTSRNKGAGAERELTAHLSEKLGLDVKRKLGQARDSGDDIQIGRFRIEVKRRETLSIMQWCRQVEACCGPGDVPIVAFRQNSQGWRIVLKLEDFLPYLQHQLQGDSVDKTATTGSNPTA